MLDFEIYKFLRKLLMLYIREKRISKKFISFARYLKFNYIRPKFLKI